MSWFIFLLASDTTIMKTFLHTHFILSEPWHLVPLILCTAHTISHMKPLSKWQFTTEAIKYNYQTKSNKKYHKRQQFLYFVVTI